MDRLTAVRVFVEVADRGSLTQAADHLEMSLQWSGRYLAAAEAWFRQQPPASDDPEGQPDGCWAGSHPIVPAVPARLRRMSSTSTVERSREPAGMLRVTTSAPSPMPQLTAALVVSGNGTRRWKSCCQWATKPLIVTERVDLAVRLTNNLDPTMITRPLARCRSMLCASPDYLARHGVPKTADDLRQHRCIARAFGIGKQYRFTRGERSRCPSTGAFTPTKRPCSRRAVLSGAGIDVCRLTIWATTCARRLVLRGP